MRRLSVLVAAMTAVVAILASSAFAGAPLDEYWVSPDGLPGASYTKESPGTYEGIPAARKARANADKKCLRVVFAPGTYSFAKIFPKATAKDPAAIRLWVEGGGTNVLRGATGDPKDVVFDGTGFPTRALTLNGTSANFVEGITFRHFTAADRGGAIRVGDHFACGQFDAAITNCVFERNSATTDGGALYGGVRVYGCRFVQNVAFKGRGGAFFGAHAQHVKPHGLAEGCLFIDNAAPEFDPARLADTSVAGWCSLRNSKVESWRRDVFGHAKGPFVNKLCVKSVEELLAARDRLRKERERRGEAEIVLADGYYALTNRIRLTGLDSRLTVRAAHPGKAVFVNGFTLRGSSFRQASGNSKLAARLPEAARKVALMADVPKAFQAALAREIRPQLAVDTRAMTHARWPNVGGVLIPKDAVSKDKAAVKLKDTRFANWTFAGPVEAFGMTGQYASGGRGVSGYVATNGTLVVKGVEGGMRLFFHGVLEEIDSPGEWCYDRASGKIVLWPDASFTPRATVAVATSGAGFFDVTGDGVRLENLVFTASLRGNRAVSVGGGSRGATVAGCTFSALGGDAVAVDAFKCTVQSCDFVDVGGTGVSVKGGDKRRLVCGGNAVDNCLFERVCKMRDGFASGAVNLDGVGSRVSHCVVHDIREHAMDWGGYGCVVEYCRFYEANLEFRDSGVVYAPGGARSYGCHFRYNDISGSPGLSHGIYPDDMSSGHRIYGNVVRNVGWGGVFLGGGRNNVVSNNVIVGAGAMALHNDNRGLFWPAWADREKWQANAIRDYDYVNGPIGKRWPEFARWRDDGELMFGNVDNDWVYNVVIDSNVTQDQVCLGKFIPLERQLCRDNLSVGLRRAPCTSYWRFGGFTAADLRKTPDRIFKNVPPTKVVKRADGLDLYAYEKGDFNLADDSVLKTALPGFTPIPWNRIGLYMDAWRKSADATL